jgi:hypothetical protein
VTPAVPRLSFLPPLVAVALLAGAPARSLGATPPAAEDAPEDPPSRRERREPVPTALPSEWDDESWIDVGHAFVEQRLFAPILRLDRFFSDERDIEAERARSFLRWRSEVRSATDASQPAFTTGVQATLRLPGLNKQLRRLRVVIAGETRDAISTLFPPDPSDPARELTTDDEDVGSGDAGLRYYLWDTLTTHGDLGAGILAQLPPGGYGRFRLRLAVPIRRLVLARSALTGFWRSDTRFGTSAVLDLERPVTPRAVVRLAGNGTITEVSRGAEWGTELALITTFGMRSAAQWGAAMNGATDAPTRVDRYRLYTRLRRDFYRRWFFLELEPEVAWPWTLERGRYTAWGVAFRVEVQFRGNEAPGERPPPPAESEDPPRREPDEPGSSGGNEALPDQPGAG